MKTDNVLSRNSGQGITNRKHAGRRTGHARQNLAVFILFAALAVTHDAHAVDRYWDDGGTDDNWSNATNWSGDAEPTAEDDAYIGHASYDTDARVTISQSGEVCRRLYMGYHAGTTGMVTMSAGRLTISTGAAYVVFIGNSGYGKFTQNGGVVSNYNGYPAIGFGGFSKGDYVLNGGELINVGPVSELHVARFNNSVATFTQGTGTTVTLRRLYCGVYVNSMGTYTMSGGVLNVERLDLGLGASGGSTGIFIQRGGTNTVSGTGAWIGVTSSSTGRYEITGGELIVSNELYIGAAGTTGTLDVGPSGTVTCVSGTFRVGDAGVGALGTCLVRGGTINAGDLMVRRLSAATGTLRGWGPVKITGPFTMNGLTIADGFGADRVLALTNYTSLANSIANSVSGTNGWYAENKGKLDLKGIPVASDGTYYWGDTAAPDLINAVQFDFSGVSGGGELLGSLLATNRFDVPRYTKGSSKIAAVWEFATNNFTFTSADVTFRYDHVAAAGLGISESALKVYRHDGGQSGQWMLITNYSVTTNNKTITASNITALAFYAVGDGIESPAWGSAMWIK